MKGTGDSAREGWLRWLPAVFAVAALAAALVSDFFIAQFWVQHAMLTAILSALLVVLVSAAVVEVILDRRAERRWRILAQYALLEMAENAHFTWTTLARLFDAPDAADLPLDEVHELLNSPQRAPAVKRYLEETLADPTRREALREGLGELDRKGQELVSRWAVVMTGSGSYAGIFDRHVELLVRIHFLDHYFHHGSQIGWRHWDSGGAQAADRNVDTLISALNIAVRLEGETWALALRVVPLEWWDRRTDELAAAAHHS